MNNKRIGVITHWNSKDNYGQKLQGYALQIVLKELGYDSFLIRYLTDGGRPTCSERMRVFYSLKAYVRYKLGKVLLLFDKDRKKRMNEFLLKEFLLSKKLYTRHSILKSPPEADCYITGSDQVWNKLDGSYYLDFVKNGAVKVSYAASFGGRKYIGQETELIKGWLKDFSSISVREENGVELCWQLGISNARLVPDPTLLLNAKDYRKLFVSNDNHRSPYIFLYLLGHKCDFKVQTVYAFAEKRNLKVVYVVSQGQQDEYPKEYPTVQHWLALVAGAQYVVTNSFHGTVFSLIFERGFIAIPLSGDAEKMNDRLFTLLDQAGLMRRFTKDCNVLLEEISYGNVKKSIDRMKQKGVEFLKESLRK